MSESNEVKMVWRGAGQYAKNVLFPNSYYEIEIWERISDDVNEKVTDEVFRTFCALTHYHYPSGLKMFNNIEEAKEEFGPSKLDYVTELF